jgi:ribosomal protein S18 acetylase RimI-like enzyme
LGNLIPQRPRPIGPTDNTKGFDSGEESLNQYLAARALANHVADLARCYVCVDADTGRILGFYTLSAVAIERAELPGKVRRNSPNPVPAVLLGRLAIDTEAQGSGLGRFLVRDAILSTLTAAERVGVRVLLVHALNEQAVAFYEGLGFRRSHTDPLHLYLLLADARRSIGE